MVGFEIKISVVTFFRMIAVFVVFRFKSLFKI